MDLPAPGNRVVRVINTRWADYGFRVLSKQADFQFGPGSRLQRINIGHGNIFSGAVAPGSRRDRAHRVALTQNGLAMMGGGFVAVDDEQDTLFSIAFVDLLLSYNRIWCMEVDIRRRIGLI